MSTPSLAFERRTERRVLLGVAGGFADQHGVDVMVVRAALVLLTLAGGLGIVLYVLGHLLAETDVRVQAAQPRDQRRNLSVAVISLGLVSIMRSTGLWLGDELMLVALIVCAGVALLGVFATDGPQPRDAAPALGPLAIVMTGRRARWRVIAGGVLIATGVGLVGASNRVSGGLRFGAYATALTILGVSVLVGPWLARAAQDVAEERRQRIRLDERAAMAAHLHDSVLQTLALIQRSAGDPRRTVTLARRQEAELRQWLYGSTDVSGLSIADAVRAMVAEVEDLYDVRIDVVVVGDREGSDQTTTLIAAAREACVNAAKHSGVADISLYVEVSDERAEAFVRDRGRGFDPDAPTDGQGLALSVRARIERAGGEVRVDSRDGEGTEVRLSVPLLRAAAP